MKPFTRRRAITLASSFLTTASLLSSASRALEAAIAGPSVVTAVAQLGDPETIRTPSDGNCPGFDCLGRGVIHPDRHGCRGHGGGRAVPLELA
jgi:hypothetical protein